MEGVITADTSVPPRTPVGTPQRSRWATVPGRVSLALFVVGHSQDIWPILAPLSLVPLAVLAAKRRSLAPQLIAALLLCSATYLLTIALLNGNVANVGLVEFIRRYGTVLYCLGLFVVFLRLAADPAFVPALFRIALVVVAVVAALYVFAFLSGSFVVLGTELMRRDRLDGFLSGPNPTAGSLGSVALAGSVALVRRKTSDRVPALPRFGPVILLLIYAAFLASRSRGYTLALACAVAYLAWSNRSRLLRSHAAPFRLLIAGCLAAAALSLVGARFDAPLRQDENIVTRIELWRRAEHLFFQSPVVGLGMGSFQQVEFNSSPVVPRVLAIRLHGEYPKEITRHEAEGGLHTHNLFLKLLAETGLLGTALFFTPFAFAWKATRGWKTDPWTALGFRCLFVYLAAAGMTAGLTMISPTVSWPLYVLAASALNGASPASDTHPDRLVAAGLSGELPG